jgi:hypothetical protein
MGNWYLVNDSVADIVAGVVATTSPQPPHVLAYPLPCVVGRTFHDGVPLSHVVSEGDGLATE